MPEEETFCVFVKLMEDYGMRELYKPNMSELGLCIYQLENLVEVRDYLCLNTLENKLLSTADCKILNPHTLNL